MGTVGAADSVNKFPGGLMIVGAESGTMSQVLANIGDETFTRIASTGAASAAVLRESYRAVLIVALEECDIDQEGLRCLARFCSRTPLLVVAGEAMHDTRWALRNGADDCIWHDEISPKVLDRAIRYAASKRKAHKDLIRLANFDDLTGIANRRYFHEFMEKALAKGGAAPERGSVFARARNGSDGVALVLLDLDNFKMVNDVHGHQAGDAVLAAAARRLRGQARGGDVVARLGGDEFAILLCGKISQEDLEVCAKRLVNSVRELRVPVAAGVAIGASVGVAVAKAGDTSEELFKRADCALYAAKQNGRNTWQIFDENVESSRQKELLLELEFKTALEKGDIEVVFQPIVARDRSVVAVEALARWFHPDLGQVPPCIFVPMAERQHNIWELGRWVLQESARTASDWRKQGIDVVISVNVSASQVQDSRFEALVTNIAKRYALPLDRLQIEITEDVMLADPKRAREVLFRLQQAGLRIALDDFGAGFSSLSYIRELPIDVLKLDGSFAQAEGDINEALIRSVCTLGRELGISVVAEWVETEKQLDLMHALGCGLIQGFLVGKPMDAAAFSPWLADNALLAETTPAAWSGTLATPKEPLKDLAT